MQLFVLNKKMEKKVKFKKIFIFTATAMGLLGCSGLSKRQKDYLRIAGGAVVGGIIGEKLAPKGDNKNAHQLLGAATGGAIAGVVNATLEDPTDIKELSKKNEELHKLIVALQNKDTNESSDSGNRWHTTDLFEREIPDEFKDKVIPGKWRLRRVIKSIKGNKSNKLTIGRELEIIPPKLKK